MHPPLLILSTHPARFAALCGLWAQEEGEAGIALIDATDGATNLADLQLDMPMLVLAPARLDLPPQARWLASPARAETIATALGQLWRRRMRRIGAASLWLDPPRLEDAQGEALALSEKEAHLLAALVDHPEGITRAALLAQWWGMSEELDTHALETLLYRLRQKLRPVLGEGLELGIQKGLCRLSMDAATGTDSA